MATMTEPDARAAAERARRIEEEASAAVQDARKAYQQAGLPMAGWRDGRIVWVDPTTLEEVPAPYPASQDDVPKAS